MLEIGSLVDGKYKVLSKIGQGGMSVVYMAINEKANKTWAIKEVRKDGVLDFESVKQGLIAETDILKKLSHPHLPSIIDVIDNDDSFLIIMDYVQGVSLNKTLEEGAQSQEDVIEWAKQLCDVLGYLHSREPAIIYRDMKPSNVMLKPDGNIALIDFGTAREFKKRNLADTTCLGTVGYAAPEQFGGMGQTDGRTDIYCLGATLYHLVTGKNPSEPPYEILPIRMIDPTLSGGLEKIILKCTQKNPEDRYQSAEELMYALEHYEELDEVYEKQRKRKWNMFTVPLYFAVFFAVLGIVFGIAASLTASDSYSVKIEEARRANDYNEQIKLYEECMEIPSCAGEEEAYLGLIEVFKEDSVFDKDYEAKMLEKLITKNFKELTKNKNGYVDICFELGKLYWYYYDYGDQTTRATAAAAWFNRVVENASWGYDNLGMAKAYLSVGEFMRDIIRAIIEGIDEGMCKDFYDNITKLVDDVAADEDESEIVRLEVLEIARSAFEQYASKFSSDGVSSDDMLKTVKKIQEICFETKANVDKTKEMKKNIESMIDKTVHEICVAYDIEDTDEVYTAYGIKRQKKNQASDNMIEGVD